MDHTFVICAYKESPYLKECILSLKNQTVFSKILLSTSTPSDYLENLCIQYDIGYCVRNGQSGIAVDWNYALSQADTRYVTIAHQDDVYEKQYTENVLKFAELYDEKQTNKPILFFTDYSELVNGEKYSNRINLIIKRILLWPIKWKKCQGSTVWKRHILRYGNAISCPTVTYCKDYIDELLELEEKKELFQKNFRSNLDWEAWEWLSRKKGSFVYIPRILMAHRIHSESETTATIHESKRGKEDYEMFCKFWPKCFAKIITGVYSESEKSNEV